MFLLDTNVVSELRKRNDVDPNVQRWAQGLGASKTFLSAISILEIEIGVLRLERKDRAQGARLRTWFQTQVLERFDGRILPVDSPVARRCAQLHVPDPRSERDALIAATAIVHGLTVATCNTADFEPTGVALVNPWETF